MTFIQENAYLILLHGCSLVQKTSVISDCAARLHLMQTLNFQLLNTCRGSARETLIWLESVTEKETGNAQPGACVDVLPRCWFRHDLGTTLGLTRPLLQPRSQGSLLPVPTEVAPSYACLSFVLRLSADLYDDVSVPPCDFMIRSRAAKCWARASHVFPPFLNSNQALKIVQITPGRYLQSAMLEPILDVLSSQRIILASSSPRRSEILRKIVRF